MYLTNAISSPTSSRVNMYSSSNFKLICPVDIRLKRIINHYFLQREHVNHYHVGEYDPKSMILSLLSCYTTTINNIYFRYDLLSTQEVVVLLRCAEKNPSEYNPSRT